jgi:curved DNA-binding protein CbpA
LRLTIYSRNGGIKNGNEEMATNFYKVLAQHPCPTQYTMPEPVDYYRVLHVSRQATLLEIKKSFRRLARQFHPDLNPKDDAAAAQFQQISAAYAVLSDRQRRANYDALLSPEPDIPNPQNVQVADQQLYQRGLDCLALRDYPGAIAAFDQAISLNPESVDAYLGRCRAHEELKNDRAILDDCYQLLQIDPQLAQAYYHQGRARFRLGYLQGAVEAYTHAIALQDTFALAYYQRGRILLEMGDSDRAREDLQKASQLFRVQNNLEQYRQAEGLLNHFRPYPQRTKFTLGNGLLNFFAEAVKSIPVLLLNPSANIPSVFAQLGHSRAAWTGVLYGFIMAAFVVAVFGFILIGSWPAFIVLHSLLAVGRLYSTLAVTGAIAYKFTLGRFQWQKSLFIAGVAVFPIAVWALLVALEFPMFRRAGLEGSWALYILKSFVAYYGVLILYLGLTKLGQMAEAAAMVIAPLMLIASTTALWAFLL